MVARLLGDRPPGYHAQIQLFFHVSSPVSIGSSSPSSSTAWWKGLSYWSDSRGLCLHLSLFLLQTLTPDSTLTFYLLFPSLLPSEVREKERRAHLFSATTWGPWICLIYPRIEQKLEREGGQIMEAGSRGKKGRRLSALSSSPNRLLVPSSPVTATLPLFLPQSYSSSIFPLSSGSCILPLASCSPTLPEGSVFKYLWQEQWIVGVSQHLSTLMKIEKKSLQAEGLLFQKLFCVRTGCHEDVRNNFQVCHSQITFGGSRRWPVQWL